MRKINLYTYITAALALLVPVPGRFAYGIVLVLLLNILLASGTLFRKLVAVLKLQQLQSVLVGVFLVAVTVLYKELLNFVTPGIALNLGYVIYMPAVSSFLIGFLYEPSNGAVLQELKQNMVPNLMFSGYALVFFLLRDIIGYGTITFAVFPGVKEIVIQKYTEGKTYMGVFFTTIPGALVMVALSIIITAHAVNKAEYIRSIAKEEEQTDAQ